MTFRYFYLFAALIGTSITAYAEPHWNEFGELVDDKGKVVTNTEAPATKSPTMPANDFKIEAGVRAGQIRLGMKSRELLALFGKPKELFQRSQGIEEIVWQSDNSENETRVILGADAVIQINVSDSRYRDVLGNGTTSPLNTIFARYRAKGYPQPKRVIYSVNVPEGGGYEANIYDDVATGISYAVYTQDVFDESAAPSDLIVHRAGKAALPPKGSTVVNLKSQEAIKQPVAAPATARKAELPTISVASGSGLPLTESVDDSGARSWGTTVIRLPNRVFISANALTSPPPGQYLAHPLTYLYIGTVQDRAVWQDVSSVTFSWGYRRISVPASKSTSSAVAANGADMSTTMLLIRFPFRDFIDMAGAGKFVVTIGNASFQVDRPQTVGIRALARLCGAQNISLDDSSSSRSISSSSAKTTNRRPVKPYNRALS